MSLKKERKFSVGAYKFTWERVQQGSYRHFTQYTRDKPKSTVLDIGTGPGVYIPKLGKDNFYIFTDFDIKMLQKAKVKAKKALKLGNYCLVVMDASQAMNSTTKVDFISSLHVVTSVQDQKTFVLSALEMLKPSGELLLYVSEVPIAHRFLCSIAKLNVFDIEETIPSIKYQKIKINTFNYCYVIKRSDNEHMLKAS